ncbi:hypothetical protein EJ110_NYTH17181 [Nymphaea thermarum]|nr:hypothetical protein EJ110_NYTH17181 [Nymphaea thermarum]
MAGAEKNQFFDLLTHLLQKVEAESNQEEVELRAKIEALGEEVTKVPSKSAAELDELEIARQLDNLSAKLNHVDAMISSAMTADPDVQTLLQSTSDLWMPVITATSAERRTLADTISYTNAEEAPTNK